MVAMHQVNDGVLGDMRAQPQGGRPAGLAATRVALVGGQVATGARVGALRRVRCSWGLLDIPSAAEAFVEKAARFKHRDRGLVALGFTCLPVHLAVPGQPDRRQVIELAAPDLWTRAVVEVLDAHQERAARRAGEQPGQHRGAQIADVQVGGRAWRESAGSGTHRA
jgi:hypothetical protein